MGNQSTSIALAALMILSVFAAGVGTVTAAGDTELTVTPENTSVDVGDTQTYDIVVESGSDGSQGYNLTVQLTNGSVAEISGADTAGNPGLQDKAEIDSDNDSVNIVGGYLNALPGAQPLTIATVTVEGTAEGSTDIEVNSNSEIRDGNNRKYTVTGYNSATMTITDSSADFQVSNLNVPGSAMQGDTVTATATVSNAGSASGTETVEFSINGSVLATTNVTLAAGTGQNVTLSAGTSSLVAGTYSAEMTAGSSSASDQITIADTDISLVPQGSTTTVGGAQTYEVVIDRGSDGSQGYDLTVELDNGSVAEIIGADTAGSPGLQDGVQISSDNNSVDITAGYLNPIPGAEPLTIANVTVEGTAEGTTSLSVNSSSEIRDGNNRKYVVGDFNPANVTVISSGPAYQVSNLNAPSTVLEGDTVVATATVTNVGTASGTESVELSLGGTTVASTNVTLAAGASQFVNLSADTSALPVGQHTLEITAGSSSVAQQLTIAETTVSVTPASAAPSVGGTQTYDIVVDQGSDGSQGYNLTVQLTNGSVAEIIGADTAGSPSLADDVQINSANDSVNLKAGYINPLPGASPLTIATVTVEGTAKGSADIVVDSSSEIRDGTNTQYIVGGFNSAELLVGQSVTLPGAQGPAQSVDSDPLLEDVDGDGSANVFDSITLYNNLQEPVVQNNPQFFDFDGDGKVNVFDAIALYNKIS